MLSPRRVELIVESTPLSSSDLVVRVLNFEILLSEPANRPAHGCRLIPGDRILKDYWFLSLLLGLEIYQLGRLANINTSILTTFQETRMAQALMHFPTRYDFKTMLFFA